MDLVLLILLILIIGGFGWGWRSGAYPGEAGIGGNPIGLIVLVLVILLLVGMFGPFYHHPYW